MEELIKLILPYLDAGGSVALILMVKVAWSILTKITSIEKSMAVYEAELENNKFHIQKLEDRFNEYVDSQ